MASEPATAGRTRDGYTIRPFEADDRDAYLSLYATVFGARPSDAWFDWKYASNPYTDHVPIVVAERDGTLVGARSFLALALRTPGGRVGAFQACDTMVHPDHRRRGLFTRMTRQALDRYAGGDPALSFNFPNEKTLAGNRKLGWQLVENLAVYYRYQQPAARLPPLPRPVRWAVAAGGRGYLRLRERLGPPAADVSVTRATTLPTDTLVHLAQSRRLSRFHVPRDEPFYRWRYDRPDRTYRAYVARRSGEPVGAAVFGTGAGSAGQLMEVLPRAAPDEAVSAALLRAGLRDHADASVVTGLADDVSPSVLASSGFLDGTAWPLRRLVGARPFVVRPFTDDGTGWELHGADLRDPGNWLLSFGEFDVG